MKVFKGLISGSPGGGGYRALGLVRPACIIRELKLCSQYIISPSHGYYIDMCLHSGY